MLPLNNSNGLPPRPVPAAGDSVGGLKRNASATFLASPLEAHFFVWLGRDMKKKKTLAFWRLRRR